MKYTRKKIEIECFKCKKIILKDESEVKRNLKLNRNSFCSLSCASNFNKIKIKKEHNCNCSMCGTSIYRNNSRLKASKHKIYFCSRKCKDIALKFENGFTVLHPSHYIDGLQEYRNKVFKDKEKQCERCGFKEYPEIIQVHHKDRDRDNNDILNLEILCPNCHMLEHYKSKDGLYNNLK